MAIMILALSMIVNIALMLFVDSMRKAWDDEVEKLCKDYDTMYSSWLKKYQKLLKEFEDYKRYECDGEENRRIKE